MTRYLPIRKEEFDLRSHVESSGHSVETCYHVIITEKLCKGYLVKMGGKIKSWKKRWFVFDRLKRTFSYYVGKKSLTHRVPVHTHPLTLLSLPQLKQLFVVIDILQQWELSHLSAESINNTFKYK